MLRIYDTTARSKVDFVPRKEGAVSMYVCGLTPYDAPHLGHGRTAIVFDVIRRYLRWRGFQVTFVSNITDVEDRIIARAAERGTTEPELARAFEQVYWDLMDRLNVLRPDEVPPATAFVDEMQAMISELVANGSTYVIEGHGVYFEVATLGEYGALSHRSVDELLESAGARVDVDERKRSPIDFALWKAAKPGEPSWWSPWGDGRPGWHIECSAMSLEILGDGFDLHGGGDDLVFPHHENEIAQAVGAGHEFARHWLHAGMVNATGGEKMSKSLGNFVTLENVLDRYDPRAFRMLVLQNQYRRQMEFGDKELADAEKAVEKLDALVRRARRTGVQAGSSEVHTARFRDVMDDDFDTPNAVANLFELVRQANTAMDDGRDGDAAPLVAAVWELSDALGIEPHDDVPDLDDEIAGRVAARDDARARGDYAAADEIRGALRRDGIALEDTAGGTVWRRVKSDEAGEAGARGEQVEGRRAVLELLRADRRPVHAVYVARNVEPDDVLDEIVERAGSKLESVPEGRVVPIARSDTPQGVVARAGPLPATDADHLIDAPGAFLVALDGVTDPRNLGAVLRAAETAGVTGVVLPRHRSARVTPW